MHSKTLLSAAALSSVAFAQVNLPIPTEDAAGLASLIQEAIPTEYQDLIPSETQVVDALAAYVTSITAQPEFGSAVAALQTAVPLSAIAEIGANPEAYIMDLATGEVPDWYTAIPTGVFEYIESIGEQALSLVEAGTGISALPAGLIGDVEASATAAYGAYTSGGYSYPVGGYAYPTGGYYPTAGTAVSSGFPVPTGNASVLPYLPTSSPSPSAFTGAAAPKNVAMGAAAMVAGVAALFVL